MKDSTDFNNVKDNPDIEMQRRLGMANLLVQNPKTFDKLVENNVNIFHSYLLSVLIFI